mmetsp:Transcript_54491/g.70034  ORF Transcript_54491/g.70034 Transcript_54491/m.70034 type:complete len:281 (-) Transcript_54491:415-1257(-)
MILSISRSFHSRQYRFFVARVSFSSSPPPPEEPPSNPQWLVEAMTKTPVLDLSERNTYSDYLHPTIDEINHNPPPRRFSEFDHVTLAIMASQGVHGAFKERMLREVMRRDKVSYGEAFKVLGKMNKVNERNVWIYKIPYVFGMATTFSIGAAAIPCVFHKETAIWFCINFVKDDVPTEPEVLDTMFKVGTWTWGWMEPMIGTASFVLLAAQLMRSQMQKIDLKPFGRFLQSRRADYLTRKFPRYEREIVRDYAKSDPWGRDSNIARRGFPANSVIPQKSE